MQNITTMDNWVKEITDLSILSKDFSDEIQKIINENIENNPLIIKVPENKNNNSFLLCFDSSLNFISKVDNKIISNEIKFNEINFIKLTIILLHSSFEVNSSNNEIKIDFNTSSEDLFHKIIDKIRKFQNKELKKDLVFHKLDYLKDLNLKLYNYSKYALKYHDKIVDTVYQNYDSRSNSESNLTILSNNELIFIKETDEETKPKSSLYGGTWVYMPLNKISDISITNEKNKQQFSLDILFDKTSQYKINYNYDTKSSFKEFDKKIKKLL